ncbi:thioesterase II family protein [Bordetella sp. N]|uniref:thioesterase II family protein n=1 Tax=Bordetella sp. N TaxID=1746199 RepID=UPI000A652123|nr:alpha/beta fold hydrolase [Bordetella sp. N]
MHLFCLPYAGGNAGIYRDWAARLPAWVTPVPLLLPARGVRYGLAPVTEWPVLLDLLEQDVAPYLDRPYAVFGHSMGALIGLELARRLRDRRAASPVWFGASACVAPTRRQVDDRWLTRSQGELVAEVRELGGTAAELLDNEEFMALVTPMLRADFHLCGTHPQAAWRAGEQETPLNCPITVYAGRRDSKVSTEPRNLEDWRQETRGSLDVVMFDADHFFVHSQRDALLASVGRALATYASHPSGD